MILSLALAATLSTAPRTLTVLGAASLKEGFTEIGRRFEGSRRGVKVRFSFAGSQTLVRQLSSGAPADILATADRQSMREAVKSGRVSWSEAKVFATNRLVIAVPAANPARILAWRDLARNGVQIVLADKRVPAGRYARELLSKADRLQNGFANRTLENVVSYEQSVRAALTKVALGEADASIVYETDARAESRRVKAVEVPGSLNVQAEYLIAPVSNSRERPLADAFAAFVLSPEGQRVLKGKGFGAPIKAT